MNSLCGKSTLRISAIFQSFTLVTVQCVAAQARPDPVSRDRCSNPRVALCFQTLAQTIAATPPPFQPTRKAISRQRGFVREGVSHFMRVSSGYWHYKCYCKILDLNRKIVDH